MDDDYHYLKDAINNFRKDLAIGLIEKTIKFMKH